jgi:class 3 adenylate cyclase
MAAGNDFLIPSTIDPRKRISTALLLVLGLIAIIVVTGLSVVTFQLFHSQKQINVLRERSLPRLVKLSQLSQESSASIAIAPSLSTNPTRFAFETLLSRIKDKTGSQEILLSELGELITDKEALDNLRENSALLTDNQSKLTSVVRQQIHIRKRLEKYYSTLRKQAGIISKSQDDQVLDETPRASTLLVISNLQSVLLDPIRARFSRNRKEIQVEIDNLQNLFPENQREEGPINSFLSYWAEHGDQLLEDKAQSLTNAFKIKALVEENSLIANRLLNTANSEFVRANAELAEQVRLIASVTRVNLVTMFLVALAFIGGAFSLWFILKIKVFQRLEKISTALGQFTETRHADFDDDATDEIGAISRAVRSYIGKIDDQERELERKARDLTKLSARLSKYLSPQVYESVFSGKQNVTVSSSRKKLTVFFSDIVGFTELADQQESEELTQLLNQYLTEMTRIALDHGATIDKYIGDAIMAFFGDPETSGVKEDAFRCVSMAIAMRDRLTELNREWKKAGIGKPLICRTGIHTGFCTVGNFGSDERMDYTIIGRTVNTASRLEKIADVGQILISYETYALVKDEIICEARGQIEVKGIAHPISTYAAIKLRDAEEKADGEFWEINQGVHIELDRESMNAEEKSAALKALERAIQYLKR